MSARTVQRDLADCRGFTFIEAMIATILIGMGVAALMVATKSGTQVNANSRDITRAAYLGQEIREWAIKLPFVDPQTPDNPPGPDGPEDPQTPGDIDDLDDLMGVTYSPPRNGRGQPISDMTNWSQQITLTWRDPDDLLAAVSPGISDMICVEVAVLYKGRSILTTGWLVKKR